MSRKDNPQGTENVLMDLGFDNAEELSAKAACSAYGRDRRYVVRRRTMLCDSSSTRSC